MSTLAEIMPMLAQPFDHRDVGFLPKPKYLSAGRDGQKLCKSLAFADKRVYEDRLNAVCPGEWTSQAVMTVAGNKIICVSTVVICGVPHTDVGEADLSSENAATESLAQAFKRACSQVGLGRFLYALDAMYLPWDASGKGKYILTAEEKQEHVKTMYRKAGLAIARLKIATAAALPVQTPEPEPTQAPARLVTVEQMDRIRSLAKAKLRPIKHKPKTFEAAEALITELSA